MLSITLKLEAAVIVPGVYNAPVELFTVKPVPTFKFPLILDTPPTLSVEFAVTAPALLTVKFEPPTLMELELIDVAEVIKPEPVVTKFPVVLKFPVGKIDKLVVEASDCKIVKPSDVTVEFVLIGKHVLIPPFEAPLLGAEMATFP